MVIDFHTHAFPDAIATRAIETLTKQSRGQCFPCSDGTADGLVKNMDRFGVDLSVVLPVVTKPAQTLTVNTFAKQITGERLISFGGIHPDTDDYKRDIDLVCSLGLPGIKLHPEYQQFDIDEPRMFPLYDYALSKGLMLIFHAGHDPAFDPPWHSSPKRFADVYKTLGGGTIICAHLGGINQWDEVEQHLVGTEVYLDTSMGLDYYSHEQFLRIVKAHGADKILFGSDSPWSEAGKEIATINSLPLTEQEKTLILCDNAKRLLDIE